MKILKILVITVLILVLVWTVAFAQTQESQSMKLLELKSAQLAYALSEADYNRYVELKKDGLTSEADYKQRETAYMQAKD